jgi:UDP-glucose 4-epimerase
MTERILADAANAGRLKYVILRYFNVAGADPRGRAGESTANATHLIKVACQSVLSKEGTIKIFGSDYPTRDGTCIRDYIHVADLADAHLSALNYLRDRGGSDIFNCGYGQGYSVLEVIRAVEKVSGRRLKVEFSSRRAGDPAVAVASNAKVHRLLSWRPRLNDLRVIIRHALRWEKHLANIGESLCAF